MITYIKAISLKTMESMRHKVINDDSIVVVSIISPDKCEPIFKVDTERIITRRFSDITPAPFYYNYVSQEEQWCTSEDAEKIVSHIMKWKRSKKPVSLYINCSAGICRSGAIAEYAFGHSNIDKLKFMEENKHIMPNQWVLWKLIEAEQKIYGELTSRYF